MLEQEFEKLLAAYFEEELDERGLARLREAIQQTPARRRRFQRELRVHTLMREAATVLLAREKASEATKPLAVWFQWRRVVAYAACLIVCGLGAWATWNYVGRPPKIGRCLHVLAIGEATLIRQGRQLSLRTDTVLRAGDRIQTGCEVEAVLEVEGAGRLTLNGLNTLDLFSPTNEVGLVIQQGDVLIEAAKRGPSVPPLVIRTPQSLTKILGTVFGMEVEPTATRVRVYEGVVGFEQPATAEAVRIAAGQYSVASGQPLKVLSQSQLRRNELLPGQRRLAPVADESLQGERVVAEEYLKVQGKWRKAFLKFQVQNAGHVVAARLRLTQMVDSGMGTLRFWEGSHSDWTEQTLSPASAPTQVRQIASRVGWVGLGQVVEVDISPLIREDGTYTLIITLDKFEDDNSAPGSRETFDIWFGSRESLSPPELILTCQP